MLSIRNGHNGKQGPIFLGGPERSGKTYLRMMLAAHPHIALSRRTNMWTSFYGRFGNLNQADNFERCLHALMQRKLIRKLDPDVDQIRHEFWRGAQTYARLFALFHEQYARRLGKVRWGDQTGLIEQRAAAIFAAYPDAKMIQMIRDPRDRFEALCARDPRSRRRLGQATAKWLYSEACARRNQRAFPDQYKVVRYESMVSQPEETMRDVCHFLGETFMPAMLTLVDEPRFRQGTDGPPPDECPLSTRFIGCYSHGLSSSEITFIQAHAGTRMRAYDYAPTSVRLTASEWVRFYAGSWGLNGIQMVGWRVLHAARNRLAVRGADKLHGVRQTAVHTASQPLG
jgi:hypothetical protein